LVSSVLDSRDADWLFTHVVLGTPVVMTDA
jgi:hypothetical protein